MEDKKEKIRNIQEQEKENRHKEVAVLVLAVLAISAIGFLAVDNYFSGPQTLQNKDSISAEKTILIDSGIKPYRTTINSGEAVKFKNRRSKAIEVSFETYSIDEKIRIPANGTGYFDSSKYSNLPKTNYFNLENGDTGEINIQN